MNFKYTGWLVAAAVGVLGFTMDRPAKQAPVPYDVNAAKAHLIPARNGAAYVRTFKKTRDAVYGQHAELKSQLNIPESESFNRDAIAALLSARDATDNPAAGVRIYFGLDSVGQMHLVLVPHDARGNDIVTFLAPAGTAKGSGVPTGQSDTNTGGEVVEAGLRCPPECPPDSGLTQTN